ncbi:MAG: type II toxin-antitoxin system RelE/ParE family toxin [Nanoarchaeota archaeon]
MVRIDFDENFKRTVSKIKDNSIRERIEKLLIKIRDNPEIGKPMRHNRKGTREVYLSPFRLSYAYNKANDIIVILDLYHKDEQ